jgi:hypothetical protein
LFSLWPLLAWIYENRFANFHQGLSPKQKPEDAAGAVGQLISGAGCHKFRFVGVGVTRP